MTDVRNLAELAEDALQRQGERRAMLFDGEFVTNAQILTNARRLQTAFIELGLGKGDVATLCMANHSTVYSIFGGIFRTGATAVPVMAQLTPAELRYIFHHTETVGIVTDATLAPKVRDAIAGLDHVNWLAVLGGDDKTATTPREYSLEGLLQADETPSPVSIPGEDVAMMLYTSGTTGRPKGVMLTHDNLLASCNASIDASELHLREHPSISLNSLPMAHIFGVGTMNAQYRFPGQYEAGFIVQEAWFDPARFMGLIEEHKVTDISVVPTMLAMMLARPEIETTDLSSLAMVNVGAAPVPLEVADEFARRSGCFIRQLYGMTENTGQGTAGRISKGYRPGAAGLPYIDVELQIFDDDDNVVPVGTNGEIVTRGPATMKGYFKDSDATAAAMKNNWLHTGDIGYLDEDGFLFVVDRKKDMIIKGGENIFPAEVENALYTHSAVAEAAVVGVPHDVYGEDVVAYVVKQADAEVSEADLVEQVKQSLTAFKSPTTVYFLDQLPKSGVGKILRRELREMAARAGAKA